MAENSIAPGQKHDSGTGTEINIATVTLKYDNVLPPKNDEAYIRNMGFACFKTFSKITPVTRFSNVRFVKRRKITKKSPISKPSTLSSIMSRATSFQPSRVTSWKRVNIERNMVPNISAHSGKLPSPVSAATASHSKPTAVVMKSAAT